MKHLDRCPEKEVLEKLLNNELTDEMSENIFSHVKLCDNCKNTIKCLLSDERNLLKSLFNEPVSSEDRKVQPSDACISKVAILAYANECLGKNQLKLVESHLEKCDNCLNSLIELQKNIKLPLEVEFNSSTVTVAPHKAEKSSADVLELALRVKDNVLELINHTGELLNMTPQCVTVRGQEQETEKVIVIRKDLKDKDLSIELTVNKELIEGQNNVKVSLIKLSTEEFIQGAAVSFSGKDVHQIEQTDEEGMVEFYCNIKGSYVINVQGNKSSFVTIE